MSKTRAFLILFVILAGFNSNAQTLVFSEDFESLPLLVTSSGSSNWSRSSTLASSGIYADSARIINPGDSAILTTQTFSTTGNLFVQISFDQICKIEFFDEASIEVSADNGITWHRLTGSHYGGTGLFSGFGDKFNGASYPEWEIANSTAMPNNQWWKQEVFNISSLVANVAQVKIRFVLRDGMNNGSGGNYGWLIDNIKVHVSPNELIPPQISLANPVLPDTNYHNGPFPVFANITDSSGVLSAAIVYSSFSGTDTVLMTLVSGSLFKGYIPSYAFGSSLCYHVFALDASPNQN
jgi:hypothetical protein